MVEVGFLNARRQRRLSKLFRLAFVKNAPVGWVIVMNADPGDDTKGIQVFRVVWIRNQRKVFVVGCVVLIRPNNVLIALLVHQKRKPERVEWRGQRPSTVRRQNVDGEFLAFGIEQRSHKNFLCNKGFLVGCVESHVEINEVVEGVGIAVNCAGCHAAINASDLICGLFQYVD